MQATNAGACMKRHKCHHHAPLSAIKQRKLPGVCKSSRGLDALWTLVREDLEYVGRGNCWCTGGGLMGGREATAQACTF
ncbi:hypothetical protein ABBQ32_011089 [Trebouxia sp. C0010 RCD-2024]